MKIVKFIASIKSPFSNALRGTKKVKSLVPIYGVMGTIRLLLRNVFWLERMYRLEMDLDVIKNKVEPKITLNIVVHEKGLDLSSWDGRREILEIRGNYGLIQFEERHQRGDLLVAAYWEERFVGFIWLELPPVEGAGYLLKKDEAYIFDVWTFEPYRGMRVLPALLQVSLNYIRVNNPRITTAIAHIALGNKPSIDGFARAGYNIQGVDLSLVFLGYHRKIRIRRSQ